MPQQSSVFGARHQVSLSVSNCSLNSMRAMRSRARQEAVCNGPIFGWLVQEMEFENLGLYYSRVPSKVRSSIPITAEDAKVLNRKNLKSKTKIT